MPWNSSCTQDCDTNSRVFKHISVPNQLFPVLIQLRLEMVVADVCFRLKFSEVILTAVCFRHGFVFVKFKELMRLF